METINAEAESEASTAPSMSPVLRQLVLAAMCLALVLVVAGVTMLVNALPVMSEELELSQAAQAWVVDAYALPFAALLMIAGAMGDRYGRRGALLAGTALFGIGSALSAGAGGATELFAYRAVAGIGAALIMPGTLSTITSVFPADQRGRAVGVWSGFAMTGGTLGLLGSGLLLQEFWWGSVFVATAVVAALAFLLILAAVPSTCSTEPVGLDPGGTLLSILGIGGVVFGIIEGPEQGWTSPATMTGLVVGVVALVAFVWWELRVDAPLLDPRLFRLRGFGTGSMSLFVMFLAMFGFFLVSMQFLQLMLGYSPLKAAVALLPQAAVMMPLSAVAASLSLRVGQRRLVTLGLLLGALGMGLLATLQTNSGYWHFFGGMMIVSVAIGLAMTPATTAIVNALPPAKQGVASAVNDTAREVGVAVGVAIVGSSFNIAYRSRIEDDLGGLPPEVADGARDAPAIAMQAAGQLGDSGLALLDAAREAFISGLRAAMLLGAVVLAFAAVYAWWRGATVTDAATLAAHDGDVDGGLITSVAMAVEPCWGSGAGAVLVRRFQVEPVDRPVGAVSPPTPTGPPEPDRSHN